MLTLDGSKRSWRFLFALYRGALSAIFGAVLPKQPLFWENFARSSQIGKQYGHYNPSRRLCQSLPCGHLTAKTQPPGGDTKNKGKCGNYAN